MQLSDVVQPRSWIAQLSVPVRVRSRHDAFKCRRYLQKKRAVRVHPAHDKDSELVYAFFPQEDALTVCRQFANGRASPITFELSVAGSPEGTLLELRAALPRWFVATMTVSYIVLIASALFLMDWWPCILTFAILGTLLIAGLHVASTDQREIERFLRDRFGDSRQGADDHWGL